MQSSWLAEQNSRTRHHNKKGFWLACRRSQVFSQAARRCTCQCPAGLLAQDAAGFCIQLLGCNMMTQDTCAHRDFPPCLFGSCCPEAKVNSHAAPVSLYLYHPAPLAACSMRMRSMLKCRLLFHCTTSLHLWIGALFSNPAFDSQHGVELSIFGQASSMLHETRHRWP